MSNALQPRVVTMTVYSGTAGGVGKSTIAANLAAYLARYFPVMLVDLGVDKTRVAASYHGVDLAPGEIGVVQAWLESLDGAPNPPQPAVKPSARAPRVYVMPPGPVAANELARRSYSVMDAAAKLYSIITYQARIYRTPLVVIDTPAGADILSDLALFAGRIALVVLPASSETSYTFDGVMDRVGKILAKRATFVIVNKEIAPANIVVPFPVHHLPHSSEVELYFQRRDIFIAYKPMTDSGRRWQTAFKNLAEAVAKRARELMGV